MHCSNVIGSNVIRSNRWASLVPTKQWKRVWWEINFAFNYKLDRFALYDSFHLCTERCCLKQGRSEPQHYYIGWCHTYYYFFLWHHIQTFVDLMMSQKLFSSLRHEKLVLLWRQIKNAPVSKPVFRVLISTKSRRSFESG